MRTDISTAAASGPLEPGRYGHARRDGDVADSVPAVTGRSSAVLPPPHPHPPGLARPRPPRRRRHENLDLGLNVEDLDRSKAFYTALGYRVVGEVPAAPLGSLTMLKL